MVKHFYFYMRIANRVDDDDNILEEQLETVVRGKRIKIIATFINTVLSITDIPTKSGDLHVSEWMGTIKCQLSKRTVAT